MRDLRRRLVSMAKRLGLGHPGPREQIALVFGDYGRLNAWRLAGYPEGIPVPDVPPVRDRKGRLLGLDGPLSADQEKRVRLRILFDPASMLDFAGQDNVELHNMQGESTPKST